MLFNAAALPLSRQTLDYTARNHPPPPPGRSGTGLMG